VEFDFTGRACVSSRTCVSEMHAWHPRLIALYARAIKPTSTAAVDLARRSRRRIFIRYRANYTRGQRGRSRKSAIPRIVARLSLLVGVREASPEFQTQFLLRASLAFRGEKGKRKRGTCANLSRVRFDRALRMIRFTRRTFAAISRNRDPRSIRCNCTLYKELAITTLCFLW